MLVKMTHMVGPFSSSMQHQRGKSSGWAAFDRKQREKGCTGPGYNVDPFPPVSKAQDPGPPAMNHCPLVRSFSSVFHPPMGFPSIMHRTKEGNLDNNHGRMSGDNSSDQVAMKSTALPSIKSLKSIHGWAEESLIEDVLAAVNNNEEHAFTVLRAMVSNDFPKEEIEPQEPGTSLKDHISDKKDKCTDQGIRLDIQSAEDLWKELASVSLLSAPVEPEWEADDIYLTCRKDAIRMMRLASQHSRAAGNAFQRGDHFSAHQLSLKAREEWISAEKLNEKAAKEILHIRNSNNDVWMLDLHGLHASEAVNVLKEHLHRIETLVSFKHSVSPDGMYKSEKGAIHHPLLVFGSRLNMEAPSKQQAFSQQRQNVLHVVTGTGNHSKGQAALPTAVKSFLVDKGYRFDDARPGVIAVRPKFRHSSTTNDVSKLRQCC